MPQFDSLPYVMSFQLFRTGNLVTLDNFHRELLASMLSEEVPHTLPVSQAQALVTRVKALSSDGMAYGALLGGMLQGLTALLSIDAMPALAPAAESGELQLAASAEQAILPAAEVACLCS